MEDNREKIVIFDSHAHINYENYTEEDRERVIAEIEASDLGYVMDVAFDWHSSEMAAGHGERLPWCYAVVGVHPHEAKTMNDDTLEDLKKLALEKESVKAIGEIGLDFYYDNSDRETQRHWFRKQLRLALDLGMPIVIHSREADMETLEILKEEGAFSSERKALFPPRPVPKTVTEYMADQGPEKEKVKKTVDFTGVSGDARVDIHCFSGSRELAIEYVKLGATLGVDGPVTYKNNRKTVEVVEAIPLEFIMAETDAPYLTPVPHRGKQNKSEYVEYTLRKIAEIKGISYEEAAAVTTENGKRFFNI